MGFSMEFDLKAKCEDLRGRSTQDFDSNEKCDDAPGKNWVSQ